MVRFTLYYFDSKNRLDEETFFVSLKNPCVKCPPYVKSNPIILSPGYIKAVYTARFAGLPE